MVTNKPYRQQGRYVPDPNEQETLDPVSLTVPDESYSIEEMMIRHSRGLAADINKTGEYYNGDLDSPDIEEINAMDLIEKDEYLKQHAQKIERDIARFKHSELAKKQKAKIERSRELKDFMAEAQRELDQASSEKPAPEKAKQ